MDGFVVPVVPIWFRQNSIVPTPDNGLLYCSRSDVVYIPQVEPNCMPMVRVMHRHEYIETLACAPDWSKKRLFVTFDSHKILHVWDLDLEQPVQGHKGHAGRAKNATSVGKKMNEATSAICFSANEKVLSCYQAELIVYCLLSDSYTVHATLFRPNCIVVVLLQSPVDRDVFIAGMADGLIQIFSLKKMSILHNMRGHDKKIISIALMEVPIMTSKNTTSSGKIEESGKSLAKQAASAKKGDEARPKKQARKKVATDADTSDFLDIYDFNDGQEEFGTIIDRETENERDRFREKTKTTEGFNFLEACENLKDDILKAATHREEDEDVDDEQACERSHIKQEDFDTDDENELDDCEKLRDYVVIDNDADNSEEGDEYRLEDGAFESKLIMVSASLESTLWFWDYETGLPIDKIVVPYSSNQRICDTNFVNAVWLDERHVVVNNSNGSVFEWKVSFSFKNEMIRLESERSLAPYPVEKIIFVVRAKEPLKRSSQCSDGQYLWCSSINRKLICVKVSVTGKPTVVLDYTCIMPINRHLVVNPMESMVIALACAGPRIETFNLANIQYDSIPFKPVVAKLHGLIIVLDWHPEDEQKLAFATNEGRVGVIDTDVSGNVPVILKPFTNNVIYALKWCYLTDEKKQKRLVLFACSTSELVYYHMTGKKKPEPIICKQFGNVSNVSAANNLCFVGTQDGVIYVLDLDQNLQQLYRRKMAKRYISSLDYKQNWLAVGSNDKEIFLVNFTKGMDDEDDQNIVCLAGHKEGICKVRWNRGEAMLLVSSSYDGTIRVWDALSVTCLRILEVGCFVYDAIFSPLDENIVLYVGKGCSLSFFDYTKNQPDTSKVGRKKPKVIFASLKPLENVSKNAEKPVRYQELPAKHVTIAKQDEEKQTNGNKQSLDVSVDQVTDEVKRVTLKQNLSPRLRTNVVTTFPLTYRESNRPEEVLECIVKLLRTVEPEPEPEPLRLKTDEDLSDNEELNEAAKLHEVKVVTPEEKPVVDVKGHPTSEPVEDGKMFYNEKLFSTEEKLKQLIQEEVDNHHASATASIGTVILPQLLHKLKEVILESVSRKKLTPQLLALAPYVSHIFWRQCCQAYAYQLIESHQSLAAVPYFIASHKVDETVEALCDAKYFREAWAVCRLQKMAHDPIMEKVATEWAHHLDSTGNLEAAALVWTGVKKYKNAIAVLMKRREITEEVQRTIDELNVKLQESSSVEPREK